LLAGILNSPRIFCSHQGAHDGEISEEFCGTHASSFALTLDILERLNGVGQIAQDASSSLFPNYLAHKQQTGGSQPKRD
jgi:hypothetical protein